MRLITVAASLLLSSISVNTAAAKNYGPTREEEQQECDGKDGSTGCAAAAADESGTLPGAKITRKIRAKRGKEEKPKRRKDQDRGYDDDDDDDDEVEEEEVLLPHGQCALYLAPSTLPHAGLGLFSGTSIPFDVSINEHLGGTFPGYNDDTDPPLWTDLFIAIADKYKALPYRGQQQFPSWLQYVWPEEPSALSDFTDKPFPNVPRELWDFDTGLDSADGLEFFMDDLNDELAELLPDFEPEQRVNAFVPGIASLANNHEEYANIDRIYSSSRADYNGQEAPWHAGAGAFSPHHKIDFIATKVVREGMELLIDYGTDWNWKNDLKLKWISKRENEIDESKKAGNDISSRMRQKRGFVEGIDRKWDRMDSKERDDCPDVLPTEKAKRDRLAEGMAADSSDIKDGETPYSQYQINDLCPRKKKDEDDTDEEKEMHPGAPKSTKDVTKPLPYLANNGICLSSGKLRTKSSSIQYAGRGVFSTTHIGKGQVVLPSPIIAMRQEDFTIYKSDANQEFVRNVLDKDTVVGTELLLNYAFTHPDSPLYLVPTAPIANFINHGGPMKGLKPKSAGANVQIRWPKDGSNAAKLFEWAYTQEHGNRFDNDFDVANFNNANPWLKDHPIDVMERSGKLAFDYVALRDIHNGEEILLDYGTLWDDAWEQFKDTPPYARAGYFRHAIGVPENFFPENWLHKSDQYKIAEIQDLENKPLLPGEVVPMTWAHNGKPLGSKWAYAVGLEKGFSDKFLEYSEKTGVVELYRKLLTEQEGYHLPSDGFSVYKPGALVNATSESDNDMEFFAHRYHSDAWNFNMHFVAAWSESARKDVLAALGNAGFDIAVSGIGERFGYDNMTCFHASYMGVTHCDKAKMHSDIYGTDDKSWNIVFPIITVEGTDPELDIMSEDMNTIIGVHYLKDVAYAIGDFGYHKTRPIAYFDPGDDSADYGNMAANGVPIRVVFGVYCAQIDETNVAMIRHVYDGDDPAPFADQFKEFPMREVHWDKADDKCTLANPGGKGL